LTVPPFGIRECEWKWLLVGNTLGSRAVLGALAAATAVTPTATSSSQELIVPSPTSPGLWVHGLPFLPSSLALPSCPR